MARARTNKTSRAATVGAPLPIALERELLRALQPMVAQVTATLPQIDTPNAARALGVALKRKWSDKVIRALVERVGRKTEIAGSKPWKPLFPAERTDAARPVPYDGAKLLDEWSRDAVKLITSVRDEVAEELRAEVLEAVVKGTDPKTLAARWVARGVPVEFGTLEGRVKTIAKHQIQVLQAKVQSTRARALGVEEFMWRTQGDGKVRDRHIDLGNGGPYKYASPPADGLPGEPVNCRCWAESVIPDSLIQELDIGPIFDT